MADARLRAQGGFLETACQRRQAEALEGREERLVDGRGVFKLSGYFTVSGADKAGLEAACSDLERAAGAAKVCLRLLYGQQKEALTWRSRSGGACDIVPPVREGLVTLSLSFGRGL